MTKEQLTDLREQRERLAQQLKELDAEIKTTETEVYKTLVLSEDSAFVELGKSYQEHDFKTKVEMTSEGIVTCTMETQDHPKLTFKYTHLRPVTTPKQCERVCNILMDYLPCIVRLLGLGIPKAVYEIYHTSSSGIIIGSSNVDGCLIQVSADIKHSTRTGRYKQPSYITDISLTQDLWHQHDKNSFDNGVSLGDGYSLEFHAFDTEKRAKLYKFINLTRQIYNPAAEDKSYNTISKTSLQNDLKQFSKKAKLLIKEMHLQRVW